MQADALSREKLPPPTRERGAEENQNVRATYEAVLRSELFGGGDSNSAQSPLSVRGRLALAVSA